MKTTNNITEQYNGWTNFHTWRVYSTIVNDNYLYTRALLACATIGEENRIDSMINILKEHDVETSFDYENINFQEIVEAIKNS
jgi:hypothetical protein